MRTLRCVCPNMCYPEVIVADAISVMETIRCTGCKGVYTVYVGDCALTSLQVGNGKFYTSLGPYYHADINPLDVDMYLTWLYLIKCDICRLVVGECTLADAFILSDNMIRFNGVQVRPHRTFVVDQSVRIWSGCNGGIIDKYAFVALSAALEDGIMY